MQREMDKKLLLSNWSIAGCEELDKPKNWWKNEWKHWRQKSRDEEKIDLLRCGFMSCFILSNRNNNIFSAPSFSFHSQSETHFTDGRTKARRERKKWNLKFDNETKHKLFSLSLFTFLSPKNSKLFKFKSDTAKQTRTKQKRKCQKEMDSTNLNTFSQQI